MSSCINCAIKGEIYTGMFRDLAGINCLGEGRRGCKQKVAPKETHSKKTKFAGESRKKQTKTVWEKKEKGTHGKEHFFSLGGKHSKKGTMR